MNIEAYIIAWNEIEVIHLTITHYQKFCSKIYVFDNWSNDGTFDMAKEMGCDVSRFGIQGQLDDTEYLKIKNSAWKGSNADYVIVCDTDEIITSPNNNIFSEAKSKGSTIIPTRGYNMVSNSMPKDDFLEITYGSSNTSYSKTAVFSPKKINSINYVWGCHVARPTGVIKNHNEELLLLHYRSIGGANRLVKRHEMYRERMSPKNRRIGLGIHYLWEDKQRIKEWNELYEASYDMDEIIFDRNIQ